MTPASALAIARASWLEDVADRAWFFFARVRNVTIMLSFFFLWSALFQDRARFLGYSRAEMLTYVLGMSVLRALVLASRTGEIPSDINTGRLAAWLLRPFGYRSLCLLRDVSDKLLHLVSAFVEVGVLVLLFHPVLALPSSPARWLGVAVAVAGAAFVYFQMSFLVGCAGFWTAESVGPRFCFELFLEFAAGAFFPLDVLPQGIRDILHLSPFPLLIYEPLQVLMGRMDAAGLAGLLARQTAWALALAAAGTWAWRRGLRDYTATGG